MLFVSWHSAVTTILTAMATTHTHIDTHRRVWQQIVFKAHRTQGYKDTRDCDCDCDCDTERAVRQHQPQGLGGCELLRWPANDKKRKAITLN